MTTSTDFASLSLPARVLANLTQLGYTQMTPIQAAALPVALLGKDLIAQAKTGSGKTAAFGIALLANLNVRRFAVQAMVLCPTRELADQVATEIRGLARAEENVKVAGAAVWRCAAAQPDRQPGKRRPHRCVDPGPRHGPSGARQPEP